jgi:ABC-type nitrate/sulfonate/bicarbonate transport system permease component
LEASFVLGVLPSLGAFSFGISVELTAAGFAPSTAIGVAAGVVGRHLPWISKMRQMYFSVEKVTDILAMKS